MTKVLASVDREDFRNFQRTLKKVDGGISKELNKQLRKVITTTIIPDAKANASFSSRIPAAIKPTVGVTRIGVRVNPKQAPHGRAIEGLQRGLRNRSSFRHPLFGNRERWVEQPTRPYLAPAFDKNRDDAIEAAEEAMKNAARAAGFK